MCDFLPVEFENQNEKETRLKENAYKDTQPKALQEGDKNTRIKERSTVYLLHTYK